MNNGFRFLLLLLIFLCGCTSKTTDKIASPTNDSIQKYLALAGNDTLDFNKRIKYNDKALGFLDLERNDSLTRENLNRIVYAYLNTNNWLKYKKWSRDYFIKVNQKKDTLGLARHYRYIGSYYSKKNIFDSAFYYFLKSEKLYKKIKNEDGIAFINLNISHVQFKLDDYLGSELSAKKAYSYFRKINDVEKQFHILVNIGNSNHNLNHYEKAIKNFKHALLLTTKFNLRKKKFSYSGTCLNNIGNAYRSQKKYNEAIYYFKLGLNEKNILNKDPEIYAYLSSNLGYCYLKTNNASKSLAIFNQSKKIFDDLGVKNESAICDIYLSEYFLKKADSLKANLHAESALKLAKEANAPYYYLTALSHAGSINPKKAPDYIKKYHHLNDSLLFVERNARNQYYKIQLETDEISEQKQTALKQRSIVIFIAISILIIAILVFIIARQRLKQKELRLKQIEQKANEDIYQLMLEQKNQEEKVRQQEKKRIGIELHDGIMNKLASTRLNLSILSISRDDRTIESCLNHIHDIQNIEKEIRDVAHDLNQETIYDSDGFERVLKDFTKDQNKTNSTVFELEINQDINWNTISNSKKMNLYRIIQEACYNINKHAKAQKTTINFLMDGKNVCLLITDDGIGFKSAETENGIGLKNMKHRVKMMKGKFSVSSKLKLGTKIHISIPLK